MATTLEAPFIPRTARVTPRKGDARRAELEQRRGLVIKNGQRVNEGRRRKRKLMAQFGITGKRVRKLDARQRRAQSAQHAANTSTGAQS